MLAGIAQFFAQVAMLSITLDGAPVGEARGITGDEERDAATLADVTIEGDALRVWVNGGAAEGEVELIGKNSRGDVLFTVDLDELRSRGYGYASSDGQRRSYQKLTFAPIEVEESEEE